MVKRKCKVLHIITGLSVGGAEMMLFKLLSHLNPQTFQNSVVSLSGEYPIGPKIRKLGIPVLDLKLSRSTPNIGNVVSVARMIKALKPDIIQTWMYHADFFGSILALLIGAKNTNVIWNIRHSDFEMSKEKLLTRLIIKSCPYLSHRVPSHIICNSVRGSILHKNLGYSKNKFRVIGNGFDTKLFKPSKNSYIQMRQKLNIPLDSKIIGMVARFHHQKNHLGFLQAADIIYKNMHHVHFVLCGKNVDTGNRLLSDAITKYGLDSNVHLLGEQDDMPSICAGFDIAVLNSTVGEGFPNVIGEAMACGVPCVVTDIGDSKDLVSDTGMAVPPNNPGSIAEACIGFLKMESASFEKMSSMARSRIEENFSIKKIANVYEQLYLSVAN